MLADLTGGLTAMTSNLVASMQTCIKDNHNNNY